MCTYRLPRLPRDLVACSATWVGALTRAVISTPTRGEGGCCGEIPNCALETEITSNCYQKQPWATNVYRNSKPCTHSQGGDAREPERRGNVAHPPPQNRKHMPKHVRECVHIGSRLGAYVYTFVDTLRADSLCGAEENPNNCAVRAASALRRCTESFLYTFVLRSCFCSVHGYKVVRNLARGHLTCSSHPPSCRYAKHCSAGAILAPLCR